MTLSLTRLQQPIHITPTPPLLSSKQPYCSTTNHQPPTMDDYQEDPPNPFSTSPTSRSTTTLDNPTDRPSWGTSSDHRDRTDQNEDGSKPLPPKPPLFGRSDSEADVAGGGAGGGPRTQAGMIAGYPELDLYPSGRTSSTRLFDDHDDDDEEGHGSVPHATAAGSKPTPMYPDLDLYPATTPAPTDDQTQRPSIYAASNTSWSNNAPTSPPSGRSQPPIQRSPSQPHQQTQGQPQPQGQTQRSPPPTHRPSFPSPGMGSKSYIGPKVKEEACCELDEVLTGAGGGAGGAGEGGSGNGGVVVEVSLSGLGLVWFGLIRRIGWGQGSSLGRSKHPTGLWFLKPVVCWFGRVFARYHFLKWLGRMDLLNGRLGRGVMPGSDGNLVPTTLVGVSRLDYTDNINLSRRCRGEFCILKSRKGAGCS